MERIDLTKRVMGEHDPMPPSSSHMHSLRKHGGEIKKQPK